VYNRLSIKGGVMILYKKNVFIFFFTILLLVCAGSQVCAVPGDVDVNGSITIIDALKVAQYYVGLLNTLPDLTAAEVNCDEFIDIIDALMIARFYVGLLPGLSGCNDQYPLTIPAVSIDTVRELQAEFDTLNDNAVFAEIDQFGLLSTNYSMPYDQRPAGDPLEDKEEVLTLTRETLIKNSKFTNVTETTLLDNYITYKVPASNSYWIITYTCETYDGIKISPFEIRVEFKRYAYYISGYFPHPSIIIPENEEISLEQAKASVIGEILTFYNVAGERVDYEVTEDAVTGTPGTKAIIADTNAHGLEYRYCWEVWIDDGMWYMYVDVITGDLIEITQNFQT
jgi:hypothetical protein